MSCPFVDKCVAKALGGEDESIEIKMDEYWRLIMSTTHEKKVLIFYNVAPPSTYEDGYFAIRLESPNNGWFDIGVVDKDGMFHSEDQVMSSTFRLFRKKR